MLSDLLGDILGLRLSVPSSQDGVAGSASNHDSVIGLDISIRVDVIGTLEDVHPDILPRYRFAGTEPIVDVIETKNAVKIIIVFSGIRKENVHFNVKNNVMEIEIAKNGHVFKKEIPRNVEAEQISIKSSTINNSVLEATFIKK